MIEPLKILYLDREHAADRLFVDSLARTLAAVQRPSTRMLIVHGGASVTGMRAFNKHLVAKLTDEVVAAVGIQGSDKRLLQRDAEGTASVHRGGWLEALIKQGIIPVVSSMAVVAEEGVRALPPGAATEAVCAAFADLRPVVVGFTRTNQAGLQVEGEPAKDVRAGDVAAEIYEDVALLERLAEAGVQVVLTNLPALRKGPRPEGTHVKQ